MHLLCSLVIFANLASFSFASDSVSVADTPIKEAKAQGVESASVSPAKPAPTALPRLPHKNRPLIQRVKKPYPPVRDIFINDLLGTNISAETARNTAFTIQLFFWGGIALMGYYALFWTHNHPDFAHFNTIDKCINSYSEANQDCIYLYDCDETNRYIQHSFWDAECVRVLNTNSSGFWKAIIGTVASAILVCARLKCS